MAVRFIEQGITKYPLTLIDMEIAKEQVLLGEEESIFIVQHEPLYSAGKSFERKDFLLPTNYPIYFPRRGGRVTVHSPGQLVIYPIINLRKRGLNIHDYIKALEDWIIKSLVKLGINSTRSNEGIGVWINDAKVGFIGVRIERGVSTHGLCLNISNDLSMFNNIVPCGINGVKITSLEKSQNKKFRISEVSDVFINTSPF